MSTPSIMQFDNLPPVPDMSVLELAVVICAARRPGCSAAAVAAELTRWFGVPLSESDLGPAIGRLARRQWVSHEVGLLHAAEEVRARAEFAARGIIHLVFKDRFFFDVGKLLDVAIVREESPA